MNLEAGFIWERCILGLVLFGKGRIWRPVLVGKGGFGCWFHLGKGDLDVGFIWERGEFEAWVYLGRGIWKAVLFGKGGFGGWSCPWIIIPEP